MTTHHSIERSALIVTSMMAFLGPFMMSAVNVALPAIQKDLAMNADARDISGILDHAAQPLYLDFCHLSEKGNEIVAERISKDVIEILESRNRDKPVEQKGRDSSEFTEGVE